jgi:hypothetical protein
VDAAFAAWFPFEVFDNISDVRLFTIDACCIESIVEQRPAGPTKGLPERSSSLPGCSPINMTFTRRAPSPKTVCVPVFQRSQAWQSAAALFSDESVGRGGIRSSAALLKGFFGITE